MTTHDEIEDLIEKLKQQPSYHEWQLKNRALIRRLRDERDEACSAMLLMFSVEEVQKIIAKIPEARNNALDEAAALVERLYNEGASWNPSADMPLAILALKSQEPKL